MSTSMLLSLLKHHGAVIRRFPKEQQRVEQQSLLAKGHSVFLPPPIAQAIEGKDPSQLAPLPQFVPRHRADQADKTQLLQSSIDLIEPGDAWLAHEEIIQNNGMVRDVRVFRQIVAQAQNQRLAFFHVFPHSQVKMLVAKLAFVQAPVLHFLQKSILSQHLEAGVGQQEEQIINFELVISIPDAARERALSAKAI